MRGIRLGLFDGVLRFRAAGFGILLSVIMVVPAVPAVGQAGKGADEPVYTSYRGVQIGSTQAESRKALGDPKDKADGQDFYLFGDNEMATIFFDANKKVNAISIDFLSGATNPPAPMQVVGSAADSKPDGSAYKLVRYPKAGYWVCYNKTAGQSPTISVTMQKMQ
jgi:hypothetical protein